MPIVDLVDPELSAYQSSAVPPNDLLEFWNETIAESRAMATPRPWSRSAPDCGSCRRGT